MFYAFCMYSTSIIYMHIHIHTYTNMHTPYTLHGPGPGPGPHAQRGGPKVPGLAGPGPGPCKVQGLCRYVYVCMYACMWLCPRNPCKANDYIMILNLCAVQFCVTVAQERIGTHAIVDNCLKR